MDPFSLMGMTNLGSLILFFKSNLYWFYLHTLKIFTVSSIQIRKEEKEKENKEEEEKHKKG